MRELLDIYAAKFKIEIAVQMQYRVSLIIWLIGGILEPVIYLVVWSTVARSSGGSVGGFTPSDFAAYYIAFMLVNHLTMTWVMMIFEGTIRDGSLSSALLRSLHPIHFYIAENTSYKLLMLTVIVPTALVLFFIFEPTSNLSWGSLALAIPAVIMAFFIRFFLEWTLALVAFWTTRIGAFNQIYFVLLLFFSGQVAPLSLMPQPVQFIANLLPFRAFLAFPIELVLGRLSNEKIIEGYIVQIVWVALGVFMVNWVWRVGIRRFGAVGS